MAPAINHISEFPKAKSHGGWDGMCAGITAELGRYFEVHYVGPVRPQISPFAKAISKARRLLRGKGNFHYYSQRRLDKYAEKVAKDSFPQAHADFFHGSTPWIRCQPPRPYYTYIDVCFETYLSLYLDRTNFRPSDVSRIVNLEKRWLSGAARTFVSSGWCANQLRQRYGLAADKIEVVGVGGAIRVPARDEYRGELQFLFAATNFERKGGRFAFEGFQIAKKRYPDAALICVGQAPPRDILSYPGVTYAGYLHKSVPAEQAKLEELFSRARALLLPTAADASPLILAEVGYFGCPAITVNRFGIGEMVKHNETGILLESPLTSRLIGDAMLSLCATGGSYDLLRTNTRRHCIANLTWERVVEKIVASVQSRFNC
jgi:glycosyltransferase involved in cell wall biosynthesis